MKSSLRRGARGARFPVSERLDRAAFCGTHEVLFPPDASALADGLGIPMLDSQVAVRPALEWSCART